MSAELLAPAGNLSILYAVVNAGADAVYVGGPAFGARAYAQNFSEEDLLKAITYCHLHSAKLYMTVNTLMKEEELSSCIEMLKPFYLNGLDGVIIQDLGLFVLLRETFPGLELHCSTQMSISSPYGATIMKELGAKRIVPSRELSLAEIKEIKERTGLELECFIHGALCYSYSGMCLMSSCIGGRSGNRGRCAQPCRLPYEAMDCKGNCIKPTSEILSLKDLCTIELLPDLLEAGIDSLKIEGRMKQASYAYTVVSVYRKYLDMYDKTGRDGFHVDKNDLKLLMDSGNRDGFTDGYYKRKNGKEMMTKSSSSHNSSGLKINEEELTKPILLPLELKATVEVYKPIQLQLSLPGLSVETEVIGPIVEEAKSAAMDIDKIRKQLVKTGDSFYHVSHCEIDLKGNAFIPVSVLNNLRREGIENLNQLLSSEITKYRKMIDMKKDDLVANIRKTIMAPKDRMSETTCFVQSRSQFEALESFDIKGIGLDVATMSLDELKECYLLALKGKHDCYFVLPYIMRKDAINKVLRLIDALKQHQPTFYARSYDGLGFLKEHKLPFIADQHLYTYNLLSDATLRFLGAIDTTYPYELKRRELDIRSQAPSQWVIYGKVPAMITQNCLVRNTTGCDKTSRILYLKDRMKAIFPVRNECDVCTNVIYNSVPTCLFANGQLDSMNATSLRFEFSDESSEEVKKVLNAYFNNAALNLGQKVDFMYTSSHYHKGVL